MTILITLVGEVKVTIMEWNSMKKIFFAIAAIAVAAVACTKEGEAPQPEKIGKKHITVIANPSTKTVLDDQHEALKWVAGDNFRLMTDTEDESHDAQTLNYEAGAKFDVEVSTDATEAYAYYFAGEYDDPNHSTPTAYTSYINYNQPQTKAGVLNGQMLPMAAKGTIKDNTASLEFHQMAGVLALNIYSTAKVEGEVINSVKVTPTANTKFCGPLYGTDLTSDNVIYTEGANNNYPTITVELGESYDYASAKPTDKKMFDSQIYVVLAKQSYTAVKFEIETNKGTYTITSSGAALDLVANDFYPVNINLAKATFSAEVVELDWTYPTNGAATSAGIAAIPGVKTSGLGSDYASGNAPYCIKFDNTDDYIQIRTDKAIGSVSVKYKMIGGSDTSKLEIYESENGTIWAKVEDLTISGEQNSTGELTTSKSFNSSSRYVKINFNKGSNVGIGGISISANTNWVLSAIKVATEPNLTQYIVGQTFNPEGMVITADYVDADNNSNTKTNVPVTGYTYSPSGELTINDSEITISYSEGEVTKTTTQAITVSEPPTDAWVETSLANLSSDDVFVIVGFLGDNKYAMTNANGTSDAPSTRAVSVSGSILTGTINNNLKWTVSGDATNGYSFYPFGSTDTWLYCNTSAATGSNNNLRVGTGNRKLFTLNSDSQLETKDDKTKRYISIYNEADWRGYVNTDLAPTIKFYRFTGTVTTPVAAPTFSVPEGTYTSTQTVELSCSTTGATIYYTIDGSTPNNTKTEYSSALIIASTTTVKAIAIKDGESSEVVSATYTINAPIGGSTETMVFSEIYSSNTVLDGVTISGTNFSVVFTKGGTATQYYTNGSAVRWYGGGTLTVSATSGKTITRIELKFTTHGNLVEANTGNYTDGAANGTGVWTGSNTSVVFTESGASGHDRITSITVTYN